MAIELAEYEWAAKLVKSGSDVVDVAAGQSIKIETTPEGEEVLDAECPAGKAWSVRVIVEIEESDA